MMRYVAVRYGKPTRGRLESIGLNGVVSRVEFEAMDKEDAEAFCKMNGLYYFQALGEKSPTPVHSLYQGRRELCPGLYYKLEAAE